MVLVCGIFSRPAVQALRLADEAPLGGSVAVSSRALVSDHPFSGCVSSWLQVKQVGVVRECQTDLKRC
jgi:hypothetical protein